MSTKKKHVLVADFPEENFRLLAINSSLEDYKIAFEINRVTGAQFRRVKKDIDLPKKNACFSRYTWYDTKTKSTYDLFSNKFKQKSHKVNTVVPLLFEEPSIKKVYLLPEFDNADYFIKGKNMEMLDLFKNKFDAISDIILIGLISHETIKNNLNLIFD